MKINNNIISHITMFIIACKAMQNSDNDLESFFNFETKRDVKILKAANNKFIDSFEKQVKKTRPEAYEKMEEYSFILLDIIEKVMKAPKGEDVENLLFLIQQYLEGKVQVTETMEN